MHECVSLVVIGEKQDRRTDLAPLPAPEVACGSLNAPRARTEPPPRPNDCACDGSEDERLGAARETARAEDEVVEEDARHEDGEPEGRELRIARISQVRLCGGEMVTHVVVKVGDATLWKGETVSGSKKRFSHANIP